MLHGAPGQVAVRVDRVKDWAVAQGGELQVQDRHFDHVKVDRNLTVHFLTVQALLTLPEGIEPKGLSARRLD